MIFITIILIYSCCVGFSFVNAINMQCKKILHFPNLLPTETLSYTEVIEKLPQVSHDFFLTFDGTKNYRNCGGEISRKFNA